MTAEEIRGKQILTTYIALILATDLATSLLTVGVRGGNMYSRGIRLILSVFLCSALFCGSVIAKRIAIGLFSLGSAVAIVLFALISITGLGIPALKGNPIVILVGTAFVALYLSFVVVLLRSKSVEAFMAFQRRKRTGQTAPPPRSAMSAAGPQACPMCGSAIDARAQSCPACGEIVTGEQT